MSDSNESLDQHSSSTAILIPIMNLFSLIIGIIIGSYKAIIHSIKNGKANVWLKEMLFIASVIVSVVVLAAVIEAFAQGGNDVSKFIGPLEFVLRTTATRHVSYPVLLALLGGLLYTLFVCVMERKEMKHDARLIQETAVGTWVICRFVMTVMGNSLETPPDVTSLFLLYVLALLVGLWIKDIYVFSTGSAAQKWLSLSFMLLGGMVEPTLTESAAQKTFIPAWMLFAGLAVFIERMIKGQKGIGTLKPPGPVWILSGYPVYLGPWLMDILVMDSTEGAIHKPPYCFLLISGFIVFQRLCLMDILGLDSNGSGIQKPQHPVWILSGYAVSLRPWAVIILRMGCNGSTAQQGPDVAWILGGFILILGQYIRDMILIKLTRCASQAPDPVCHLIFGTFRILLGLWMMVVTGTQQNLDLILLYGGVGLAVLIRVYEKWFMKTEEEVLLRVTSSSWYYEEADFWMTMMKTSDMCFGLLKAYMEVYGPFFLTWKWSLAVYSGYNLLRNVFQPGYLTLFVRYCLDTATTAATAVIVALMKLKERGIKQTNGLLRSFKTVLV